MSSRVTVSTIIVIAVVQSIGPPSGAITAATITREFAGAAGVTVVTCLQSPCAAAMAEAFVKAQRNPATTELVERIQNTK